MPSTSALAKGRKRSAQIRRLKAKHGCDLERARELADQEDLQKKQKEIAKKENYKPAYDLSYVSEDGKLGLVYRAWSYAVYKWEADDVAWNWTTWHKALTEPRDEELEYETQLKDRTARALLRQMRLSGDLVVVGRGVWDYFGGTLEEIAAKRGSVIMAQQDEEEVEEWTGE